MTDLDSLREWCLTCQTWAFDQKADDAAQCYAALAAMCERNAGLVERLGTLWNQIGANYHILPEDLDVLGDAITALGGSHE